MTMQTELMEYEAKSTWVRFTDWLWDRLFVYFRPLD